MHEDPDDQLLLDNQVCFALYSASRAVTHLYRPFLHELGLTYPQYLVMLALWEHETLTVKDLGAALRLDSGTLSPLLKRLQSAGLVIKLRSENDERSVCVALTAAGAELKQRARHIPESMRCSTGMGTDELLALRGILDKVTERVEGAIARTRGDVVDSGGSRAGEGAMRAGGEQSSTKPEG